VADIVAKVENRATRKISRKLIFGLLRRCVAFQRHYGDPWSILDETIWSLTSPLVKRISGSKKFRSSPQKDFCNNIGEKPTFGRFCTSLKADIRYPSEHNNSVATPEHEIALRLNLDLADSAPDGTFLPTALMRGHDG
jgi:hypothetical protein